jgi:hypothetical protein
VAEGDGISDPPLEQAVMELQVRLAQLEAERTVALQTTAMTAADAPAAPAAETSFGRRSLLRKVGAVAAGAAVVSVIGKAQPAAANTNDAMLVGNLNFGSSNAPQTTLKITSLASAAKGMFVVTDGTDPATSLKAAVAGVWATSVANVIGVVGSTGASGSIGVAGVSANGSGVMASSNHTHLKLTDASGGLTNNPTRASLLARLAVPGEIVMDSNNAVWYGVALATGGYRMLAGPSSAGALHVIAPTRVYDSRAVSILAAGSSRVVQITNGTTIPTGARAIMATLTITGTTGTAGFLTITAGDVVSTASSSINWFGAGQDLANTIVSNLDGSGRAKLFNNSLNSSHFIIDVTGYFV